MTSHQMNRIAETCFSTKMVRNSKVIRGFLSSIAATSMLVLVASCASPGDDSESNSAGMESGSSSMGDRRADDGRADAEMPNVANLRRDSTGAILSVKGANLSIDLDSNKNYQELADNGLRGDQAVYFLNFYRDEFRLSDPRVEFVADSVQQDDLGYTQVRLSQSIESLHVRNAQVVVQFSPEGAVTLVQGRYLAGPVPYELTPTFDAKEAEQTVTSEIGQQSDLKYSGLSVLLQGVGNSKLVHEFVVTKSATDKAIIGVDAHSNRIVSKAPVVLTN